MQVCRYHACLQRMQVMHYQACTQSHSDLQVVIMGGGAYAVKIIENDTQPEFTIAHAPAQARLAAHSQHVTWHNQHELCWCVGLRHNLATGR